VQNGIRPGIPLRLVDQRNTSLHDALLILKRLASGFFGKEIKVRVANYVGGPFEAEPLGAGFVDHDHAPISIHDVYVVLDIPHQHYHQNGLVRHLGHGIFRFRRCGS